MVGYANDQIFARIMLTLFEWSIAGVAGSDGGFQPAQGESFIFNFILELRLNVCLILAFFLYADPLACDTGEHNTSEFSLIPAI